MCDKGTDPRTDLVVPEHLRKALHAAHLSLLDIGGRSGPLTEFEPFAPFSHLFVCEPDTQEAVRVREGLKTKGWREVSILTEAIHPMQSSVMLNITREPGLSSLLEPDRKVVGQFYNAEKGKKHSSLDDWDIVSRHEVPATTLDNAARTHKMENLSVLKIDTQGTELAILQSGLTRVIPSLLAVYVEAEFLPIYRGQTMFGDVHALLQAQGFRLVDMKRSSLRRVMKNRPVYSKREVAWVHSLYFRDTNADGSSLSAEQKYKLACVAFLLEFFDYAMSLLSDESVKKCMHEKGVADVQEDIRSYVESFWQMLESRSNAREQRQYRANAWHDRGNER